jgi:Glycosyltransferase family 28 C-terminal domain
LLSLTDTCGDPMTTVGCMEGGAVTKTVTGQLRQILSRGSFAVSSAMTTPLPSAAASAAGATDSTSVEETSGEEKKLADADQTPLTETVLSIDSVDNSLARCDTSLEGKTPGDVNVVGLGFVSQMAEYMVAADVLVSKAGPGTISEAAALSLPIMLTSYLPGQEEGNVDYVIDGGFGAFCSDSDPIGIAEEVCMWLTDETKLRAHSRAAKSKGHPHAARDIAHIIGSRTLKWIEHNERVMAEKAQQQKEKQEETGTAA